MSSSQAFAQRRMRVGKVGRNETGGDVAVHLVPDTSERIAVKTGVVIYGVDVIFRGIEPPLLDEPFDVELKEGAP